VGAAAGPDGFAALQLLWGEARVRAHRVISAFHTDERKRTHATQAFHDYLLLQGAFHDLPLPDPEASDEVALRWWRTQQPSTALAEVAVWLASMRLSQGESERQWATLSRQTIPIRSSMGSVTKQRIVNVVYNAQLLLTGLPARIVPKRAEPDEAVRGPAAVEGGAVGDMAEVASGSSSDTNSESSSDSSSGCSSHSIEAMAQDAD
jgi:hypothetical protein